MVDYMNMCLIYSSYDVHIFNKLHLSTVISNGKNLDDSLTTLPNHTILCQLNLLKDLEKEGTVEHLK